jgi:hypothetical protein
MAEHALKDPAVVYRALATYVISEIDTTGFTHSVPEPR